MEESKTRFISEDRYYEFDEQAYLNKLDVFPEEGQILLTLTIDPEISSMMEYFEIFTERMLLCKRAAKFFGMKFGIMFNGQTVM